MQNIKPNKKRHYDRFGNEIGDLQDYRALMQDYGRLRAGAGSELKPFGFTWGSPRETKKSPGILEQIIETVKPKPTNVEHAIPSPKPEESKNIGSKIMNALRRLRHE